MDKNLQKYMAFVMTVKHNSFTRAAEILNYSQSGISRMINDLEKEWGLILFERNKGGLRLTDYGAKLLPYAEAICNEYEKLRIHTDELNGLQTGLIRIGCFPSAAAKLVPHILKAFRQDYPAIDYELIISEYAEIEEGIATGRIDCGFLKLPTKSEFETIFIQRDELKVVLPKNHPLADCEKFPPTALADETFILLEKEGELEITEFFNRLNIHPKIKLTTYDESIILSMVENGLGISILPQMLLDRNPYDIEIKELDMLAHRDIGLALRSQKNASPTVKRFLDYLKHK